MLGKKNFLKKKKKIQRKKKKKVRKEKELVIELNKNRRKPWHAASSWQMLSKK